MRNIFIKDNPDDYVRDLDIKTHYINNMVKGLMACRNITEIEAREFVEKVTSDTGRHPIVDPRMKYVGRKVNGDREVRLTTFLKYIENVVKHGLILSPSLAIYNNKNQKVSITSVYISRNVKRRKKHKHEMFLAKQNKNVALTARKNRQQNNDKTKNNSLSGAHASKSTVLFIDTIHSSLTSTCRSAASYGNSNNEKITCGNRHYWSSEIVIDSILSIINNADLTLIRSAMETYNLHVPNSDDILECIRRSSTPYWRDNRWGTITSLIEGLSDVERVAFLYVSDLYHLRLHNDELMRDFLCGMSICVTDVHVDNPKQYIDGCTEEVASLTSLICGKYMDGNGLNLFDSFSDEVKNILGATAKNIQEVLAKYELLIKALLVTDCMPQSMANVPTIIRRGAIASDTDSTIFTVQEWLHWTSGSISNDELSVNVGHSVAFLASSNITHVLAKMSANIGVARDQLFQYKMKSEYWFPVFALTSRAKTYYALRGAQEGIVFNEPEIEIKGAVLKGSAAPKEIRDDAENLLVSLLKDVDADKTISIVDKLKHVANIERDLFNKLARGSTEFFKRIEIKDSEGYKNGIYRSNYFHYLLWEAVFSEKYGSIQTVPYSAIRVTLDINNATDFNAWVATLDPQMQINLKQLLNDAGKDTISTILVPNSVVESSGIPPEILSAVDSRKIVGNIMEAHYVILESLHYYTLDKHNSRLISDYY